MNNEIAPLNREVTEHDDLHALSLNALCCAPMEMQAFLQMAIAISSALVDLHGLNITYKNLCPENIGIDTKTGQVMIHIHALRSGSTKETGVEKLAPVHEQSFAYMSPEQIGRLNRAIDHRTDLYSVGVIFYQMLTGVLPFVASDLLEWVHCHIARVPKTPLQIMPVIPPVVSDIIMRLLAKAPEDRYQTAVGLLLDLERCLAGWEAKKDIKIFPLAAGDVSDRPLIPRKLYGRERDLEILQEVFARIAKSGIPELVMVSGYSGVGKTSLVGELYQSVVREHGFFIWGKSDQYKRNVPCGIFIEAFKQLIRQLLTEREERLAQWRIKLQDALGINGQLLVDMIPQVELIIGRQQPVPDLPLIEAEYRFNMVFKLFLSVFASENHPLVIFLDDLQWIDQAGLKFLENIALDPKMGYLLLIGAYRDNEVGPDHPLKAALTNISWSLAILQTIHLSSLSLQDLGRLLADTFHSDRSEIEPLVDIVYEKTEGNPFFVIQFLMALHSGNLVTFNTASRRWTWDIGSIKAMDYTDNVIDLMLAKLQHLPETARKILQLASCIGNRFDLRTVAVISYLREDDVSVQLWKAVQEGLLMPSEDNCFAFVHDRVQQAAHSLIPETERAVVHLQIGRLLFADTPFDRIEEVVFDLVNHFNQGADLISEQEERYRVAEINLLAGRKAKDAIAYLSALGYLSFGVGLLDEAAWDRWYDLTFQLHKDLAVVEYLMSNYTHSQELIALLLKRAESDLERAELYNILIVQYTLMARYQEAIRAGREALGLLDITFPETNLKEAYAAELATYRQTLGNRSIASLADEPEMSDTRMKVGLELLSNMMAPARYTDSLFFALVSIVNVNISLKYGPTAKSTVGYSGFGMVLNSEMNNYRDAYEFGLLGLRISERFVDLAQKCQACLILAHYLTPWVRHLKWSDDFSNDGLKAGLASGEMQWTGYILAYKLFQPFARGIRLEVIFKEIPDLLVFAQRTKNQWAIDTLLGIRLALTELQSPDGEHTVLSAEKGHSTCLIDENHYLADCSEHKSFGALGRYAVLKAQIHYLYGQMEEALESVQTGKQLKGYFSSSISVVELNFYHSLILAALFDKADKEKQDEYLDIIHKNQSQMQIWVQNCKKNFEHRSVLVQAEVARITGDELLAQRLFEEAIEDARQEGFTQDEGIAAERAADFYRQRGFATIAATYLRIARTCYADWGAAGKVRQLEKRYRNEKEKDAARGLDNQISQLDTITVIKASQAISGEIVIENLVDVLMRTMLENAGAQKGCLILVHGNELTIAAEAMVKGQEIQVQKQKPGPISAILPETILTYVQRTHERVIVDDALNGNIFSSDPYLLSGRSRSLLCLPLLRHADLIGILYLENSLIRGAFTANRLEILEVLAAQAVISIENAISYRERLQAEKALRQEEEKYRTIFENTGTPMILVEDDMTVSICNNEFAELTGYPRTELVGVKWMGLVAQQDRERMMGYHRLRRIDPDAAPKSYLFRLAHREGTLKDVVITVTPMPGTKKTLAAFQDITELKLAKAESARLATAIEQAGEGIIVTDTRLIIRYVNPALERMSGYCKEELIGKPSSILGRDTHDRTRYRRIRATLRKGDIWSGRLTNRKKDTTFFDAEITVSPVRDKSGNIINYVSIFRDITHEIRLEQELRQAHKMEAIGTLAGGIAHDFNNILTAIIGFTEMAKLRIMENDTKVRHYLDLVLKSGNRAAELVTQILTFSRQSEHKKKPVQIVTIVQEVLKLLRSSLPATIEIRKDIDISPTKSLVLADATQIHQVLMNLASNAAHAMRSSGGVLSVGIASVEIQETSPSFLPDLRPGPYMLLTVRDTGHGMEAEVMERIFDPYFTTKGPGEGSGIGLAVVQGIVKSHGGTILVQSEPGKGAAFRVFLPRIDSPMEQDAEKREDELSGRERILFVDDESALVSLAHEALKDFGYRVTGKTRSMEAWETFRLHPERFDLIITDMTMPILTGIELVRKVMDLRPGFPSILCTGYSDLITGKTPEELGVQEIVSKPYQVADVARIIRRIFDR